LIIGHTPANAAWFTVRLPIDPVAGDSADGQRA
jgi:hypothetical protein